MKKYKLVSSTNSMFPEGMEVPLEIDNVKIGDEVQFMMDKCVCTQDKGAIMLNRIKDPDNDSDFGAVYTLMEVPEENKEPEYPVKVTVKNINDLRINEEVDIFFETKEIMISPTDRITRAHGVTVEAIYEFLKLEWKNINRLKGYEDNKFPLEMEENVNLVLWDEWNFSTKSDEFLKEGSWNRKIVLPDGRIQIL